MCALILVSLGNDQEGLQLLDSEACNCPGDSLTYECTVFGERGGTTVWQGSAFKCTSHEISLFHDDYASTQGTYGKCGDIVGWSLREVNVNITDDLNSTGPAYYYYISELTVPVSSDIAGKIIECLYDESTSEPMTVGQMTTAVITGDRTDD